MRVNIINFDNQQVGETFLSPEIYQCQIKEDILHKIVEWQRARKRLGTRKTKGISEISGTTRKPHAQKGTGRARQGSLRSPQMRGGAVIFGPVVRDHSYSMPKKVRTLGLKIALSTKLLDQKLVIIDSLDINSNKTKELNFKLNNLGVRSALFVGINKDTDSNFIRAYKNIKNIDALPINAINVYDILKHEHLFLTSNSINFINEKFNIQTELKEEIIVKEEIKVARKTTKKS